MHIPISRNNRRMGRPPLNVKPMLVRLTPATMKRIDAIAGPNQRAQFIREAVEREIARREADKKVPKRPR